MAISGNSRSLYMVEGILLIFLGILALIIPGFFTLSLELLFGMLLILGGIFQIYRFWQERSHKGSGWVLGSGLLNFILGLLLLAHPVIGILSLTILLMVYFFVSGIYQIVWSWQVRRLSRWWLLLLNGVLALLMGLILLSAWPTSAIWAIGLLFGINMLFTGSALLALGCQMSSPKAL